MILGAAVWQHVFLADLTEPADPHITTAAQAIVVNGTPNTPDAQIIRLHLLNGGQHDTSPNDPNQYNITTFNTTDIPIETEAPEDAHLGRVNTPIQALSLPELWRRGNSQAAVNGSWPCASAFRAKLTTKTELAVATPTVCRSPPVATGGLRLFAPCQGDGLVAG